MTNRTHPPFSRDKWIILGGSLIISQLFISIGAQDSWFVLIQQNNFLPDTLFVTCLTLLLWLIVRFVSVSLQKKYDWLEHPLKRIAAQMVPGLVLPVILCAGCVVVYFKLYYNVPVSRTSFPEYEFPLSVVLVVQFNLYYLVYYFYQRARKDQTHTLSENSTPRKTIVGSMGRKNFPVEIAQIAHISIKDSLVYATTFDGNKLSINYTLEEVYKLLDTSEFFRTNRQVIINRRSCKSFLNETNGKLLVELRPDTEDQVIISQLKAAEFRKWIEAG